MRQAGDQVNVKVADAGRAQTLATLLKDFRTRVDPPDRLRFLVYE